MNLLEDNLKFNHIPLCLSIITVFIQFSKNDDKTFDQVKNHVSPKLLMMMNASEKEELFNVLKHVLLLSKNADQ